MTHNYTGKSLRELHQEYGVGASGFYSKDPWWFQEKFADEKPPTGTYELDLGEHLTNLTFGEQVEKLKTTFSPVHPAILAEAILTHFRATGERLLGIKYARTSALGAFGRRVSVGFDANGLSVNRWDDDGRFVNLGLASARKIESGNLDPLEDLNLAIELVKKAGYKVIKEL